MLMFVIVAALLLAGALLVLLPPLWQGGPAVAAPAGAASLAIYRDQLREAEREAAAGLVADDRLEAWQAEIRQRLALDLRAVAEAPAVAPGQATPSRKAALALAVLLPLASAATYLGLGRPDAVAPVAVQAAPAPAGERHAVTPEQLQQRVAALAERLQAEPDNAEGWLMLGRSYTALRRYGDAVTAFRRAAKLLPGNPHVLADLADLMAMAQGRRLAGEPARVIQLALDADPRHPKALALAGSVAFELRDYGAARNYWERLLAELPPDGEMARSVRGSVAEAARLEAGGAPAAAAVAAGPAASAVAAAPVAARISGSVELAPALAGRVAAGDTVFVVARAEAGGGMPLAVWRESVPAAGAWPMRFTLDDARSLSPQARLSGQARVQLVVRISRSGQAVARSGDLMAATQVVAVGAQGLQVVVDQVQP